MRFKPKRRKSTGCRSPISSYRSILPAPVTWMKSAPAMIFSDYGGKTLKCFGINPGGSVGFFYSEFGDHDTFSIRGDTVAMMRLEMKSRAKEARRSIRYRDLAKREKRLKMFSNRTVGPLLKNLASFLQITLGKALLRLGGAPEDLYELLQISSSLAV